MFKKNVTMVVLTVCALLAVSASLYAGKEKLKQETQKILTDEMEAQAMEKVKNMQIANQTGNNDQSVVLVGDTLFFTVRDFSMNTNIGRKIAVNADGKLKASRGVARQRNSTFPKRHRPSKQSVAETNLARLFRGQ